MMLLQWWRGKWGGSVLGQGAIVTPAVSVKTKVSFCLPLLGLN